MVLSVVKGLTQVNYLLKYKGTYLGVIWGVVAPLVLIYLYVAIFQNSQNIGGAASFFLGLLIFNFIYETLVSATQLLQNNVVYIKKVKFPIAALSVVNVNLSFINFLIGMLIFSLYIVFVGSLETIKFTNVVLLIFVTINLYVFGYAISLAISSIGAFLKDLVHFFSSIALVLLFGSPVFYESEKAPAVVANWLSINPIALYIDVYRSLCFGSPDIDGIIILLCVNVSILLLSSLLYRKLKPGFADVL